MTVGAMLRLVESLKKKGLIKDKTPIVLASDEEGNNFFGLRGLHVDNGFLLAYPDGVCVEFQDDEGHDYDDVPMGDSN